MSDSSIASHNTAPTLASKNLPRRVRHLLEGILEFASDEFERGLMSSLNEFEQQLFKFAEQARSATVQTRWLEAQRLIKRTRHDLVPRFLIALEAELSVLREPYQPKPLFMSRLGIGMGMELSLVDDMEIDEATIMIEIANRGEMRNSLPLYLLGQRFGVLAGKPAFDSESLPIGPQALCRMLRDASDCLGLSEEHRLMFFKIFEKQVMPMYGNLIESVNNYLAKNNVLPNLQYIPIRARPKSQSAVVEKTVDGKAQTTKANADNKTPLSLEDDGRAGTMRLSMRGANDNFNTPQAGLASNKTGTNNPFTGGWSGNADSADGSGAGGSGGSGSGGSGSGGSGSGGSGSSGSGSSGSGFSGSGSSGSGSGGSGSGGSGSGGSGSRGAGSVGSASKNTAGMSIRGKITGGGAAEQYNHEANEADDEVNEASFNMMRQLLASRKQLLGKLSPDKIQASTSKAEPVPATLLQKALHMLQGKPATPVLSGGKPTPRNIQHIKQDLMSQLRLNSGSQEAPVLNEEDNDAIDLVGMLFDSINKDVKPNSPAAQLLAKLQVPLLRVALQDKGFFTKQNHPARQMLGSVAESGAYWLGDDDADPALLSKMNAVVDRTVREFDGDMSLFQQLLTDINSHLQILTRKAEVAEKRHIEAARGKEKLAMARDQASTAVNGLLKDQALPRFTHTLLSQAWTDVMALTALRSGEDSEAWNQQLGVAERLIQVAKAAPGQSPISAQEAQQLRQELESSLTQVGYQGDEAIAITERLIDPQSGKEGDSASRTELTMRLKSRARFGEDVSATKAKKVKLNADEQARYEQLRLVAFGTWFEFVTNQQGDRIRRRMAWYSTTTGNCLFVNQRGQKVGEYHLEVLARMMVRGELHMVEEKTGGIIDRAWQSIMNALRSFAGQAPTEATAE